MKTKLRNWLGRKLLGACPKYRFICEVPNGTLIDAPVELLALANLYGGSNVSQIVLAPGNTDPNAGIFDVDENLLNWVQERSGSMGIVGAIQLNPGSALAFRIVECT